LTHMTPGTGYKLCMNSSGTLTYPLITSNDKNTPIQEKPESNFANWKLLEGTTSNMVAIADIKIGETPVNNSENFSAGVFDKNGKCRSIGKYTNGFWYFTIVDNVDNDELFFKVYDRNSDMTFTSIETINYQKDTILGSMSDPITVSSKGNIDSDIDQLTLYPSRPNPFKNSTSISYNISQDSHVKITIYNILGQRVKTLVNETLNFGSHSHNWNGTDDRNRPLQNGIYFYKIETDKHSETQKLLKLE
ncbi:MAG: T9SS type A sorting domain-containing protein, partial [Candidatus Cloacimonetes bacterium]|nr:T9SS type A sorting domain-containing protein [Candidatus Cloacimonadota bacterium]